MDQKPRFGTKFSVIQSQPAVAVQTTSAIASPSTNTTTTTYVLASNSLRPVTNYTLVASPQVPATQQYVVQSKARTTKPQYVSTNTVRQVLSSGADGQPSNVTYMLPSGAHIVRMSNVITTTIAGDQRPNTQYVLAPSSQPSKSNIATIVENNQLAGPSSVTSSRAIGQPIATTPIIQGTSVNLPKLNTAYYSQIKSNEPTKISFRPKLNDQTIGKNFVLTSNDWPRGTKNVPIANLQKVNTNFMQIPFIQKTGAVLAGNSLKTNVDLQQQSVRSVILPSNYNKTSDGKLVLNSVNIPTQVDHLNDKPNTVIQQLNTNYVQIPITQKPRTILNHNNNPQLNTENNIRGQQQQTIRSIILPSNYRTAMVSAPRKGADYRLVLKPVNLPPQMLRNLGPSRFISQRNSTPQKILSSVRPPTVPLIRPLANRVQNEVIANSKIIPIPQEGRKHHLVISKESIQICIDEINKKSPADSESTLILTEPAMELVTAEVTYRLFYLLRECKKVLVRSRSNVLTEEIMKQVCTEYFSVFYGNKLWPLFCLKPNEDSNDENRVWMRKHNNVNLVGWLNHPKFRNPSYIKKRRIKNLNNDNPSLSELMNISEVLYEYSESTEDNEESPETETHTSLQPLQDDQTLLNSLLSEDSNNSSDDILHSFTDDQQLSQLLSIEDNQLQTTVLESNEPSLNPDKEPN